MANGDRSAGIEARSVAGAITSMGIDELISKLAIGIAKGQMELDRVCMDIAQFMSEAQVAFGKRADSDEPDLLSLIELGFTPNFYQFVDTVLEVRVAVSSQFEESREYDTSDTQFHQDEYARQSAYESSSSRSGWGYSAGGSAGWGWGWGWGGYGWGYGASGSSYSGSSQSSSSSSYKSKNLSLTTVDAKYASTYNYAVEASSLIKTKIVPVPPPEVFEEIVRAKVQERREQEQRLRWRDQSISILATVANSAQALAADETKFPTLAKITVYKLDTANSLRSDVAKLREEYDRLTTDHWAVIRSVEDRAAADSALQKVEASIASVFDHYPQDPKGDDTPDDSQAVKVLLDEAKTGLQNLQTKAEEIKTRITPAAEGNEPATEGNGEGNGGGA